MNSKTLSFAAAITLAASTSAFAGELPTFEASGFPATSVQVAVLGAAHVQQQASVPAGVLTPVQASVLTPRKVKTATVGEVR